MKNISLKMCQVMKDCDYVQKLGKNTFNNYKYATAANVLEKVNEALVKNKIASFVTPKVIEFKDVTNQKGNTEHLATVEITVTLVDADSGETMEIIGLGGGQDIGDKAIMKAQTAALKYAWMLTLNISTGDDPEADDELDKRLNEPKTSKQPTQAQTQHHSNDANTCSGCGKSITSGIKSVSEKKFGKPLCMQCQSKES